MVLAHARQPAARCPRDGLTHAAQRAVAAQRQAVLQVARRLDDLGERAAEQLLGVVARLRREYDQRGNRRHAHKALGAGVDDRLGEEVWVAAREDAKQPNRLGGKLSIRGVEGLLEAARHQNAQELLFVRTHVGRRALVVAHRGCRVRSIAEQLVELLGPTLRLHPVLLARLPSRRYRLAVCHTPARRDQRISAGTQPRPSFPLRRHMAGLARCADHAAQPRGRWRSRASRWPLTAYGWPGQLTASKVTPVSCL